jgi:hypothetical protein
MKRATLWVFEKVDTLRKNLIQRAGRLTRPAGCITLTMSANTHYQSQLMHFINAIPENQAKKHLTFMQRQGILSVRLSNYIGWMVWIKRSVPSRK